MLGRTLKGETNWKRLKTFYCELIFKNQILNCRSENYSTQGSLKVNKTWGWAIASWLIALIALAEDQDLNSQYSQN